ncbi:MAG TPA: DUF3096 domain-containing protein [Steroidobacteraceae bacterium]|nr:DUF3096 domain-containing protein [Steroidobacteraceae bacterium]
MSPAVFIPTYQRVSMYLHLHLMLAPLVALIAGILILVVPRLLNYIVAIYLIIIGLAGLFGTGGVHI